MRFVSGYIAGIDEVIGLVLREAGNLVVEISRCLQSSKYTLYAEASHPSQVSQEMSRQPENVTGENIPRRNNGDKPVYPCSICGANNYWRRGSAGTAIPHPNPRERSYSGWTGMRMGDPIPAMKRA